MKQILVFCLLISSSLFAQIITPTPTLDIPQNSLCKKTCQNGTLSLYFMTHGSTSGKRDCQTGKAALTVSCGAYRCNQQGTECHTNCANSSNCSEGYFCNPEHQKCMPLSYQCSSNTTISGTDGSSYDCLPYVCSAGRCLERCTLTTHCSPGFVCNTATGACVVP